MSIDIPPPRHARYREYQESNAPRVLRDYLEPPVAVPPEMKLDNLEPVTRENESEYFIHNNGFSHINPNQVEDAVKIKFFGCNSIYITDGTTNLLIDPFFTRPDANMNFFWNRNNRIKAHPEIIETTLDYAEIQKNGDIHAILMTHAHWDHALDIAEVWHALHPPESKYQKIFGCKSIYHVARGGGVPQSHIVHPVIRRIFKIGKFKICFLPGEHAPMPTITSQRASIGEICQDLPRNRHGDERVDAYKEGIISDILIEHPHGLILNKGSANFCPGLLRRLLQRYSRRSDSNRSGDAFIDVLILGCSVFNTLNSKGRKWLEYFFGGDPYNSRSIYRGFWDNVIRPTKPYLLLFSHWDSFVDGKDDMLDRSPKWFFDAYECKELFEGELQRRPMHYGHENPPIRSELENYRQHTIRFIPFWEEITILPIHNPARLREPRNPSTFQLPDGEWISI